MNTPGTVAFDSKAETLLRLGPRLVHSYVKPLVLVTVAEWRVAKGDALERISRALPVGRVVVRSSARTEDTSVSSQAGAYLSVLDVDPKDLRALADAIDRVLRSYGRDDDTDQVFVQEQLLDARLSGVLSTREFGTLSPYYVFNYDDRTSSTQSVTAGRGDGLRTYVRFRRARLPFPTPAIECAFRAVEELEALLGSDRIEAELAVDGAGRVCLFQVRPIASKASPSPADGVVEDYLLKTHKKLTKLSAPHPHLHGRRSVFGVMPDWNPAEMVGLRPRALSLSLYKQLITDSIWAYQRDNYGYKNVRSFPLLVSCLGVPFIDVRVDFNSFVPKGLREPLAEKLVNFYVEELVRNPALHDKVEFEVVYSCYTPSIRRSTGRLERAGFEGSEIGELLAELRVLTNRILHPVTGLYLADLDRIQALRHRRTRILQSELSVVGKIYWLIEDCKRYGTLPFSGLARAAFIAMQMLVSLVEVGVLSPGDRGAFLQSLDTVTRGLSTDFHRLCIGELTLGSFLEEYGHLRPGTYDITCPRYDEAADRYFGRIERNGELPERGTFVLRPDQRSRLAELLRAEGIETTPEGLIAFLRSAIEGRELAKHVFTRSLSDALSLIRDLGARVGLNAEDMSHVRIDAILNLYATLDGLDLRDILLRESEANRRAYELTRAVKLPSLILDPDDVFHFHLLECEPNFIGTGSVVGEIVREEDFGTVPLEGKVVFIPSADPGYDWVFLKRIAGLVTMYGGANSHMAIRAAEQALPAVIGCGEKNYRAWSGGAQVELDCCGRRVVVIR